MLADFRTIETGSDVEADICIIGGGPAGISIALELAGSRTSVVLLESGGLEFEGDVQELAAGPNLGLPYWDMTIARQRFLGGATNHWANWVGELTELDFQPRPWVPDSGWPFGKSELKPYYDRARPRVGVGFMPPEERIWAHMGSAPFALNPDLLQYRFWLRKAEAVAFGKTYRGALQGARNIRVLLNANATNIETDEDGRTVRHVDVRALDGRAARVRARVFILACGGIDNARLLLLSDKVHPNGVGNTYDLVGRYFMEHPEPVAATIHTDDPLKPLANLRFVDTDHVGFLPGLWIPDGLQKREGLLNSIARLDFATRDRTVHLLRKYGRQFRTGAWATEAIAKDLWHVVRNVDMVGWNLYRKGVLGLSLVPRPEEVDRLEIIIQFEQSPNRASRVVLTDERDALGLRRAGVDWRIQALDKHTVRRHLEVVGAEFARLGIGLLKFEDWMLDDALHWGDAPNGAFHHMGTTRMHADPKKGVVDANCRVHGMRNLYVAGSSVFPTVGYMNPTMTIVALAIRLAEHLEGMPDRPA